MTFLNVGDGKNGGNVVETRFLSLYYRDKVVALNKTFISILCPFLFTIRFTCVL
jgi:hypothetical protein